MTVQVLHTNIGSKPAIPAFFMRRQLVLDRHQEAVAFELAFDPANKDATGMDGAPVSEEILAHFAELDLLKVVGELRGFITVGKAALTSDSFQHIPRTRFVFHLAPDIDLTEPLLARLAELGEHGFQFSLSEAMTDTASLHRLLPIVEVVRFDVRQRSSDQLVQLTSRPEFTEKKLMAEHVDTLSQFETCLALGFDYVQGYYFVRPVLQPGHKLTPSQAAIIEIIALISSDADSTDIEAHIKRDVSLSLNLLRLVNSAAVGVHRIDSLRQALMVLGRKQLANWLQVMLYAQARENAPSIKPLLMLATARGKLLELLASHHRPGNRAIADAAFTVGIMSLMDTLFSMPMAEIVRQIPVVEEIGDALQHRSGYYGDLLGLAEALERGDSSASMLLLLEKFQLDCGNLYLLQAEAFAWSDNVTRAMHA